MKKTLMLFLIVIMGIFLLLTACGGNDGNDEEPPINGTSNDDHEDDEEDENINDDYGKNEEKENREEDKVLSSFDFYPFLENVRLHYDGEGSEFVQDRMVFDYVTDQRAQIRRETGGTTVLEVIEYRDGKVYSLLQQEGATRRESFYRNDLSDEHAEAMEVLIMDPIEIGNRWTVREGVEREITDVQRTLETPAGVFEVIAVTTYEGESTFTVYYAKDYGRVKTQFEAGDTVIFTELVEVERDYAVIEEIRIYYPDFDGDQLVYIDEDVTLLTNDGIEKAIEEYFSNPPSHDTAEISPLMSEDTTINLLRLNRETFVAEIDFSEEFLTEMNAGSSLENMILTSVVRTVGDYFMTEEVVITIEGAPYQSGHFEFQEGETLRNLPYEREVGIP